MRVLSSSPLGFVFLGESIRLISTSSSSALVRNSTSRFISAIASIELELSPPQWPELLPFLYQLSASPQSSHREIGMFILFALLDTVADCLTSELATMFGVFKNGLNDPESAEVRLTTLRCALVCPSVASWLIR